MFEVASRKPVFCRKWRRRTFSPSLTDQKVLIRKYLSPALVYGVRVPYFFKFGVCRKVEAPQK